MNCKKCSIVLIVLSLTLFISAATVLAIGDDKYSQPSLKGLKKLTVVVQIEKPVADDFKTVGLTEERIRTGIELRLREASIDVVYAESLPSDTPVFHVEVNGSKRNDKTFSFLIEVELWQKANLKRNPQIEVIAATWSAGVFGLGSASNIASDVMGWVNGMMDTFIKAHASVNS